MHATFLLVRVVGTLINYIKAKNPHKITDTDLTFNQSAMLSFFFHSGSKSSGILLWDIIFYYVDRV